MSVAGQQAASGASGEGRRPVRRRPRMSGSDAMVHALLLVFVVIAIAPILVVIMNSFKTTPAIFDGPFRLPDADTFSLEGYRRVFTRGNFVLNYQNSLIVTLSTTILTLVCSTLAAFAITEYKVRLAPWLAGLFILGIMLPIRLGTVPILRTMVSWHLIDTLAALILVYTAMSIPIAVALMVTYFRSVPTELKEAARIDGSGSCGPSRSCCPWYGRASPRSPPSPCSRSGTTSGSPSSWRPVAATRR